MFIFSNQKEWVREAEKQTSNVQDKDSKSKRDIKNSVLVSISGNATTEKIAAFISKKLDHRNIIYLEFLLTRESSF